MRDEITKNQDSFSMGLNLQPSDTVMLLNGMYFDVDVTDMSTILESITQELRIMEGLYSIGIYDKTFIQCMPIYQTFLLFRYKRQKCSIFHVSS